MEVDDLTRSAVHACTSCKKNKRRCDKRVPSCSSCFKTGRVCDYSDSVLSGQGSEIGDLQRRVRELEEQVVRLSKQAPRTSPINEAVDRDVQMGDLIHPDLSIQAYYLDSDLWSSNQFRARSNQSHAPQEISAVLGSRSDINHVMGHYFQSIHASMPFVSRIRLHRLTQHPRGSMRADTALLLLCMKLVQEIPHEESPRSLELYNIARQFSKRLELEGLLTLRTIQADILLTVYEVGHGIFPAAFTRVSYCARQGVALGLHNKIAPQLLGRPRTWVDWEERQRVWWMVVFLDRYIALGGDCRPLCCEDSGRDTLLPADDNAWDSGEMVPPERVSLSSQFTGTLTPFARLVQASNLLGRVIRHCNETSLEVYFILDNFETLYQAIYSLVELLPNEDALATFDVTIARTICFSALFKLAEYHSGNMHSEDGQDLNPQTSSRVRECMQKSLHIIKDISREVTSLIRCLRDILTRETLERVSPLILHSIYNCASNMSWMEMETSNPEFAAGKAMCEDILRFLDVRWKTAGVYLELLEIGELAQNECS